MMRATVRNAATRLHVSKKLKIFQPSSFFSTEAEEEMEERMVMEYDVLIVGGTYFRCRRRYAVQKILTHIFL